MIVLLLLAILPLAMSENIFKLNLSPEEAQRYLASAPSGLGYARKLYEHDLPQGRSAYYQGRQIENPGDFIERGYLSNQFHGQDGLGKAKFGYTGWNQARVENIDTNGRTEGEYKYVLNNGGNFHVKYYADSQGFHAIDNRPVSELVPVTDTPAVKAGRRAHEKAWKEAAQRNQAYDGRYGGSSNQYNVGAYSQNNERRYEEGQNGPPRGFFYNFDYETPLVAKKSQLGRFVEPRDLK